MSAAPIPGTSELPQKPLASDPFRLPKLRHAMHLLVPKDPKPGLPARFHRVVVLELKAGVRLALDLDDDNIGVKHIDLGFAEATRLADMLNVIRRRAVARKEWDT